MSQKNSDFVFKEKQKIINYIFCYFSINDSKECLKQMSEDDEISDKQIKEFINIIDRSKECIAIIDDNLKKWKFSYLESYEKACLLFSTYMIIYYKFPKELIIEFAIRNVKKYCQPNTYKFINGVLNNVDKK